MIAPSVRDRVAAADGVEAIRALGTLAEDGSRSHAPAVRRATCDARPEVRAAGFLALLRLDEDEAVPSLGAAMESPDELVRTALVVGCLRHGGFDGALLAYPILSKLLGGERPEDRTEAARVLSWFGGTGATRVFLQLLEDDSVEVRREAARCSRPLRDPLLVSRLVHLLADEAVREAAVFGLANLPSDLAPGLGVRARDRERSSGERAALIRIVGALASTETIQALAAPTEDPIVRREAIGALGDRARPSLNEEALELRRAAAGADPEVAVLYEDYARFKANVGAPGSALEIDERLRLLRAVDPWTRAVALFEFCRGPGGIRMSETEQRLFQSLERVAFLKQVDLFREIPGPYLMQISGFLEVREARAGEKLFQEGESSDGGYVVQGGRIRLVSGGKEVAVVGVRECLGEASLLDGEARSATAEVLEDSRLLRLTPERFREILSVWPHVTAPLLRALAKRLAHPRGASL